MSTDPNEEGALRWEPSHAGDPAAAVDAPLALLPGDPLPGAPDLAYRGMHGVGVRTLRARHRDQPDPVQGGRRDRVLVLEAWYPSPARGTCLHHDALPALEGEAPVPFAFRGRGARDAAVAEGTHPVVLLAHGHPGSRTMMTHLAEPLASRGWIVLAADHERSTHTDAAAVVDSLLHRPRDLLFLLGWLEDGLAEADPALFAAVDDGPRALIGYSMGGYGALLAAGARLDAEALAREENVPPTWSETLRPVQEGRHGAALDAFAARIGAVVALAPWGGRAAIARSSLDDVRVPVLCACGDRDTVSGYRDGVRRIHEGLRGTERWLLTLAGAGHVVAPDPPPSAAYRAARPHAYLRYADGVWDPRRVGDLVRHFTVAFLGAGPGQPDGRWMRHHPEGWPGMHPQLQRGFDVERLGEAEPSAA